LLSVSEKTILGVLQGSILGPALLNLYINSITESVKHCKLIFFADDNYLLKSGFVSEFGQVLGCIESDLDCIDNWLTCNGMELNVDKTEFMWVGTKSMLDKLGTVSISLCGKKVYSKPNIKCLGTYIDCRLSWSEHIAKITKTVKYNLLCIHPYKNLFHKDKLKLMVETQLLSIIYYNAMIWGGTTNKVLKPVNNCIRAACRLCLGKTKYDRVKNDITNELGWLFLENMYIYKCCYFMFQHINNISLTYFNYVFDMKKSNGRNRVTINSNVISRNKYGDKLIECFACNVFNTLPKEIRDNYDELNKCAFKMKLYEWTINLQTNS